MKGSKCFTFTDECIDCEACVPECPVEASSMPTTFQKNGKILSLSTLNGSAMPVITEKKNPWLRISPRFSIKAFTRKQDRFPATGFLLVDANFFRCLEPSIVPI